MGLEFTGINNQHIRYIIHDKWLYYFETKYFDVFNEKYNNLIDLFGTFRLEINHLQYLQILLENDPVKPEIAKEFLIFITQCINENTVLKAYGD